MNIVKDNQVIIETARRIIQEESQSISNLTNYLDDNFNLRLDKWSMFTRFPFTTEEGNKRGCFIHVAMTNDEDFKYHPKHKVLGSLYTVSFDLDCNDEAKEILQGFSKYLKDKLIDCCDIMIVYVPNDCESNSGNIVVKDFN